MSSTPATSATLKSSDDNLMDTDKPEQKTTPEIPKIDSTCEPKENPTDPPKVDVTGTPKVDVTDAIADQFNEPASDIASQQGPLDSGNFDYYGACILPVNQSDVKDKDGNNVEVTFALLAQDAKTGKLTVLGGRPEPSDQNCPLMTAVRESFEETIGTFCETVERGYKDISDREKDMIHVTYVKTAKPYHIYVLPSELSNGMMGTFQDRRRALEKGKEQTHMKGYDKDCYSEKSKLVWVPIGAVKDHPKEVSWFTRQIVQAVFKEVELLRNKMLEEEPETSQR